MDFFALDGWVDKFFHIKDSSTFEKLIFNKSVFERLYNIKINKFKIPEDLINSFSLANFICVIWHMFEDFDLSDFYYRAKCEVNYSHKSISEKDYDYSKFDVFWDSLIYNSAINAYVSLKYKKGKEKAVTTYNIFNNDKTDTSNLEKNKTNQYLQAHIKALSQSNNRCIPELKNMI